MDPQPLTLVEREEEEEEVVVVAEPRALRKAAEQHSSVPPGAAGGSASRSMPAKGGPRRQADAYAELETAQAASVELVEKNEGLQRRLDALTLRLKEVAIQSLESEAESARRLLEERSARAAAEAQVRALEKQLDVQRAESALALRVAADQRARIEEQLASLQQGQRQQPQPQQQQQQPPLSPWISTPTPGSSAAEVFPPPRRLSTNEAVINMRAEVRALEERARELATRRAAVRITSPLSPPLSPPPISQPNSPPGVDAADPAAGPYAARPGSAVSERSTAESVASFPSFESMGSDNAGSGHSRRDRRLFLSLQPVSRCSGDGTRGAGAGAEEDGESDRSLTSPLRMQLSQLEDELAALRGDRARLAAETESASARLLLVEHEAGMAIAASEAEYETRIAELERQRCELQVRLAQTTAQLELAEAEVRNLQQKLLYAERQIIRISEGMTQVGPWCADDS